MQLFSQHSGAHLDQEGIASPGEVQEDAGPPLQVAQAPEADGGRLQLLQTPLDLDAASFFPSGEGVEARWSPLPGNLALGLTGPPRRGPPSLARRTTRPK